MPRAAREKSESGIYHVMLRGTDRRAIFLDEEDNLRFEKIITNVHQKSGFHLFAYCLMGNHVHLLIQEVDEPLELVFKRIGASYVYYFNQKYELQGHLFQDRYRSEPIDNDAYFLDVIRYICRNPVKAGLCSDPLEYPWLKCSGIHDSPELDSLAVYTDLKGAELLNFVNENCTDEHLEIKGPKRMTDRQAAEKMCSVCMCSHVQEIDGWDAGRRADAIIKSAKAGVSIRQISRLTGISKALVEKTLKL